MAERVTSNGTTVIVTDRKAAPSTTSRPGLLLSGNAGGAAAGLGAGGFSWTPEKAPSGPVSIIFSSSDGRAHVYRDGVEIGRAAVGQAETARSFGSYAYAALAETRSGGRREWSALASIDGSHPPDLKQLAKSLVIPPEFLARVRSVVTPGTTLNNYGSTGEPQHAQQPRL